MQKNSLTLCMIVCDEEESVGRAIKSALAVVDEVVVVDTGSTDNTRLIVEGYGARVIDFPWNDDFSEARNAALAAAYGDWILILDADEVLEPIRPVELGRLLSNEEALAYYARIREERPGRAACVYDKIRVFRNHPEARYRFPVHEQIVPSLLDLSDRLGGGFLPSSLSIVHYGSNDRDESGKKSRNQRLLRKAIKQDGEQPYFRYQLAKEMAVYLEDQIMPVKGFGMLMSHLEGAIELVGKMEPVEVSKLGYGSDLYAHLCSAYLACDRSEEALLTVEEGIERFGESSLLRFYHGAALLASAQMDPELAESRRAAAVNRFESMIEASETLETAPISPSYFRLYPLRYLGLAALEEGRFEVARAHFLKALELDADYTGAWCGLAKLADREGRGKEALQIYLKALKINDAEWAAWLGGADVLVRLGFVDNAGSWLRKLQGILPEHPRLTELLDELEGRELVLAESS